MFRLFKSDPIRKLREQYAARLIEARDPQRIGDLKKFAQVSAEAAGLLAKLEAAEQREESAEH